VFEVPHIDGRSDARNKEKHNLDYLLEAAWQAFPGCDCGGDADGIGARGRSRIAGSGRKHIR
ncbi:MAG: hypothetical protein OXF61_14520, partial [Acidimicrobiaceae bacterium]|nr:hypothetical protein [Acidimicrobiaceae bacterium]